MYISFQSYFDWDHVRLKASPFLSISAEDELINTKSKQLSASHIAEMKPIEIFPHHIH
jgi:hypothetical protein